MSIFSKFSGILFVLFGTIFVADFAYCELICQKVNQVSDLIISEIKSNSFFTNHMNNFQKSYDEDQDCARGTVDNFCLLIDMNSDIKFNQLSAEGNLVAKEVCINKEEVKENCLSQFLTIIYKTSLSVKSCKDRGNL